MDGLNFLNIFQGVATLLDSDPEIMIMRLFLMGLGVLLIYLGLKGILEGLLMIPMGIGMLTINAGVLFLADGSQGNLFVNPLLSDVSQLMQTLQVNWLQPVYTFAFSNGLIACLVFMGIGSLLDVGYMMQRPFKSMFIALCAEAGTVATFPLAHAMGLSIADSAAVATIGGADGPMILFTALILSEDLFVPITVVAYLYLGLTYGGYPYMIKLLVPKHIRGLKMPVEEVKPISANAKIAFCVISCLVLCLLFPVASPLFMSLFAGVIVRESGLTKYAEIFSGPILYGATFFLGLLLGVLCEANTILNREVLILLVLGIFALTISGLGGLLGGYILYFATGKKFNPVIGIAGVSCVPTCAKVAHKCVVEETPDAVVLPHALGASISGVITSAVFAGIFIAIVQGG